MTHTALRPTPQHCLHLRKQPTVKNCTKNPDPHRWASLWRWSSYHEGCALHDVYVLDTQEVCLEEGNYWSQYELNWPANYLVADEKMLGVGISNKHFEAVLCDVDTGSAVWHIKCHDESLDLLAHADTAEGVQLDMTERVVVTVTGCGVVTVWDRNTRDILYRDTPHGWEVFRIFIPRLN